MVNLVNVVNLVNLVFLPNHLSADLAPVVLTPDQEEYSAVEGKAVAMRCEVFGSPPPDVHWSVRPPVSVRLSVSPAHQQRAVELKAAAVAASIKHWSLKVSKPQQQLRRGSFCIS